MKEAAKEQSTHVHVPACTVSGNFSRSNDFVDFTDWSQSAKILAAKILIVGSQAFASGIITH